MNNNNQKGSNLRLSSFHQGFLRKRLRLIPLDVLKLPALKPHLPFYSQIAIYIPGQPRELTSLIPWSLVSVKQINSFASAGKIGFVLHPGL